jgi:hypothetical protein
MMGLVLAEMCLAEPVGRFSQVLGETLYGTEVVAHRGNASIAAEILLVITKLLAPP